MCVLVHLLPLTDRDQVQFILSVALCLCEAEGGGGMFEGNKVIPVLMWHSESPLWDLEAV